MTASLQSDEDFAVLKEKGVFATLKKPVEILLYLFHSLLDFL